MNLLIDQDDQQQPQQNELPLQTPEAEFPQTEEQGPYIPPDTPEEIFRYEPTYVRKRSILGPIFVITVLLIIIAVAAYFSFFYKSAEFEGYLPAEYKEKTVPEPTTSKAATAPTEPISEVSSQPQEIAPTTSLEPSKSTSKPQNAITEAAKILSDILMQPTEINIGTVIIDESSFSAEISSQSRSAIEGYFAGLKAKLRSDLSFYPSTGNYSGVRALITGSFPAINKYATPSQSPVDVPRLKQMLNEKAQESGLKVVELTSEKARMIGGIWQTPIFFKVNGKTKQFQSFCDRIAENIGQMAVEKIIVMFPTKQSATFVLRLQVLQAS